MPDAAKITTIEAFICHEWCKPLWFVGLLFSINFTVFSAFCLFTFPVIIHFREKYHYTTGLKFDWFAFSVTRLGDLLDFGQFFKAFATIILSKSPTFLGNFCKGVKKIHFTSEIIFRQLL